MKAALEKLSDSAWTLRGDIKYANAVEIREQGERLLESSAQSVGVDLSGMTSATSVAISVLLCWLRAAQKRGKSLSFNHLPQNLLDVARVSGLDKLLDQAVVQAAP
ncbi:STAS domain protein [gamma proteobacterium HdN1]|nr:STAS domain protein [gamma proteobacterium HdN1]